MIKRLDKKSRLLIEVIIFSLFISIITTSWAYFTFASVNQGKQNIVNTGNMEVTFVDGNKVSKENMIPGESITKTFKVKNTGSIDTSYDVYFSELINTFVDKDDLVYTLVSDSGCSKINETTVPAESGEKLVNQCSILKGQEHSYTLRITFKETNDNQNDNQGKEFTTKLSVNEFKLSDGYAVATNYIEAASNYFAANPNSNLIGTNLASTLDIENKASGDQVVLTKEGKVELALSRGNICFRKNAVRDDIQIVDNDSCNADITRYPSSNGHLHVCGAKLCNEDNKEVRLTGVSAAGLGGEKYYNNPTKGNINSESLNSARNWGANVVRIFIEAQKQWMAQYIDHEDEYIAGLKMLIDAAIESDMYVIVNWDPAMNNGASFTDKAVEAFTRVANLYPNDPHIIYEVWNEPEVEVTWDTVKTHARTVVNAIRQVSPDAVALIGSPGAELDLKYALEDPITDLSNIMYSHHMYMRNVSADAINSFYQAIETGLPFMITEWGTTGAGSPVPSVLNVYTQEYVNLIQKYNLSYAMFCFSEGSSSNPSADVYAILPSGQWDNSLPTTLLTDLGKVMKHILNGLTYENVGGVITENTSTTVDGASTYRSSTYADKIETINFVNVINVPDNAVIQWDLSLFKDNSVVGYLTNSTTSGMYDMTIAANGIISAPKYSNYLFARMSNVKSINFNGNFDTENAILFTSMFTMDKKLESIDFSNLDARRVDNIGGLCNGCSSLTSVDFTNFNAKPTYVYNIFTSCTQLTSVDLTSIDVTNATSFDSLFYNSVRLKNIDISTWNPKNPINLKNIFGKGWAIENIDMSSFELKDTTDATGALDGVKEGATIKVKNQFAKDKLLPTATSDLYFQIKE